jgi:hypothetical protein
MYSSKVKITKRDGEIVVGTCVHIAPDLDVGSEWDCYLLRIPGQELLTKVSAEPNMVEWL